MKLFTNSIAANKEGWVSFGFKCKFTTVLHLCALISEKSRRMPSVCLKAKMKGIQELFHYL